MSSTSRILALASLTALAAACGNPDEAALQGAPKSQSTKAEVWSNADAPSLFSADLQYNLAALPAEGEAAQVPWAGSYWPTYEDNINAKWAGASTEAPSTKYGRAFGVTGVEDAVSKHHGIDSQAHRTKCTSANAATVCKDEIGEQCALREGASEGYCVPSWFGICHAWAPAAIMIPEPRHPVTRNGVTFQVNDLKALGTLVHEGVVTKFVSLRCNKDDHPGAEEANTVEFDENGRPVDQACRDSNAGSFHVLLTNYLGLKRESFVFDRTYDDEVWNQPLRGYRVVSSRSVDAVEANRLLGVTSSGAGALNTTLSADVAQGAFHHFAPITVTPGQAATVTMSGTGDGDLFVRFGGQATASSYDCRPYADGSAETCELAVPAGATTMHVSVNGYTAAAVRVVVALGGTGPAPTTYAFNPRAAAFQVVRLDVEYIAESPTHLDGNLSATIDRYTHTDRYDYVLELDAAGAIIGGEWIGASKRLHPDFAWLPVRPRIGTVAGGKISYANVKSLLDESIDAGGGGGEPTGTVDHTARESGTVARSQFVHFGPFKAAAGTSLVAAMTGTGDADLYVRRGAAPTTSTYDCRPYQDGSNESCTVDGPGDLYVAVQGYAASSTFNLVVNWTAPAETGGVNPPPPPPPPPATTTHLNVNGNVALGAYAFFTLNVVAGQPVMIRSVAANDVDLYLQMGRNPSNADNVAQAYTSSGNETLRFVPQQSGTLHIGVHGYEASAFTLTTSDP